MAMPLGTAYTDILQKLRGTAVADYAEAGTSAAGQTAIETHLKRAWSRVKAQMPSKYSRMLEHVPGEVFRRCSSSQTQFTLSLSNATDNSNLLVYVDYNRSWDDRHRDDAQDSTDVSIAGQVVTLATGVAKDSWVVIEYDWDGADLSPSADGDDYMLKDLVLNIAAFTAGRELFQRTDDGDILAYVQSYGDEASEQLEAVQSGTYGIPLLDNVTLYEDWDLPRRGIRNISSRRG